MNAGTLPMMSSMEHSTEMRFPAVLRIYLKEARYEAVRALRTPAFAIPFLILPVALYLLFGVVIFGHALRDNPGAAIKVFGGFFILGLASPGLFGFGVVIAMDREQGFFRFKRAAPMPPGAYLIAKMFMSTVFVLIVTMTMVPAAIFLGHMPLTAGQALRISLISILGALPFSSIGLFVGALVSGRAAPGVLQVVYQPMLHLSGMFYSLPKFLLSIAPIWPTYRLMQLLLWASGYAYAGRALTHALTLFGLTVILGVLAVRRLSRIG